MIVMIKVFLMIKKKKKMNKYAVDLATFLCKILIGS